MSCVSPASQRGVALLTAILAAALASVAALEMTSRQQLDIRRTENLVNRTQASLYLQGAESWALGLLVKDARENDTDASGEAWATVLPPIAVDGGAIMGTISDAQGLFNLNNLTQDGPTGDLSRERYERLLRVLDLEPELAQPLIDWLDSDIEPSGSRGAEDDEYQRDTPAYRTANGPMGDLSELRLIRGYTDEVVARLTPFVTVLPKTTELNVNTAPAQVLRCLADSITEQGAEQLISDRGEEGFETLDQFVQNPALAGSGDQLQVAGFGLTSAYFRLDSETRMGRVRVRMRSLIERNEKDARVITRSRGNF